MRIERLRVPDFPRRVHVELTSICNLRCRFCAHSCSKRLGHASADVVELVCETLLPNCATAELQGTGESLLSPGFDAVLEAAMASGCRIILITNGTLLTERRMGQLAAAGVEIVVSLDGTTAATYEWHRPGASFVNVLAGLRSWKGVRKLDSAAANAASLVISMTLTAMNLSEVCDMVRLAASLEADGLFVAPVRRTISDHALWQMLTVDGMEDRLHETLEQARHEAVRLGVMFLSSCSTGSECARGSALLCPSPWEHIYVGWDGNVYPCCQFRTAIGNCLEENFEDIWHGAQIGAIRRGWMKGVVPPECQDCVLPWAGGSRSLADT